VSHRTKAVQSPGRRSFLGRVAQLAAAGTSLSVGGLGVLGLGRHARAQDAEEEARARSANPRLLIVLTTTGGASMLDAMLAIRASESANASTLNCFPDSAVRTVGPFRAVDIDLNNLGAIPIPVKGRQSAIVEAHQADMMVATWQRTSVNHLVGQRRAVSGNNAWYGRTLQEAVALTYGAGFALPNVHLSAGTGYNERGSDAALPAYCYGETVADPRLWPLSLHGSQGILGAPSHGLLEQARNLRNTRLDPQSRFGRVFAGSSRLEHWEHLRGSPQRALEAQDLITQLMISPESAEFPLAAHGLGSSPDAALVRAAFPEFARDPLEAQAALAFLLLKYRLSVTVTLGPSSSAVINGEAGATGTDVYDPGEDDDENQGIDDDDPTMGAGLPEGSIANPPLSFDFSHGEHRGVQALMWSRVLGVADRLIGLLKSEEWGNGQSLWDRTMIYVANDFGRSKNRPQGAEQFGTGHDLNDGALILSPLANGGRLLGGIDPDTGITYGFDPLTGAPDRGRQMTEAEIYAGTAQALGVSLDGVTLPDMRAMRRSA
jgi:hypothetical protein